MYGFIPGDALLRGPLYAGLPTLEAHRTAAPSAAFADLALNYGLDGILRATRRSARGSRSISGTSAPPASSACRSPCAPAMRPCTTAPLPAARTRPRGLCGIRNPGSTPAFGNSVQPDNCVERRRRCVTMDNIGYGRYSGEIQLVRADLPADEKR